MRDKPTKQIDPKTGYPTREYLQWQHEESLELLKGFMDRMGKELFVKHGIEICNKFGNKFFKTEEDLLKFMEHSPKYMRLYFTIHGKEAENEKNRNRTFVPIVVE